MIKKNIAIISAFFVVLFAASCAKEGPAGPTGPPGPAYTGSISGHVSLYDQYGSLKTSNLTQVMVSIPSVTPIYADVNGLYNFSNVPTGNYTISASDTFGYGATVINNVQFITGNLNEDIKLSAIPSFSVTGFSISQSGVTASDSIVITVTADTRARRCILFVGNSAAVSNAVGSYLLVYQLSIPANATVLSTLIPAQDLYNVNLAQGSQAYYAVYSHVVNDASVYEDLSTGKKVYNAVSNPVINSAIVP